MLKAFNDMSREAGWDEASRVSVLMDFLDSLVREGKISTDDFLDYMDKKVADEKTLDADDPEIERRCKVIVEKHKDIMEPSCTVILSEMYEEGVDHWNDGSKNHVFLGIQSQFDCKMTEAVSIAQILFGEKEN